MFAVFNHVTSSIIVLPLYCLCPTCTKQAIYVHVLLVSKTRHASARIIVDIKTYSHLLGIIAVVLNSLVLLTTALRKRPLVALEIYVINMAVCDLLRAAFGFPMLVSSMFLHFWPLGKTRKLCCV